jgi:release factor glutamine methyltransferase
MLCPTKKVFFADYTFGVWKDVYEPAEDSFLFAENLTTRDGDFVLDIGTGCGILSVVAAARAACVVATDVNPYAIRCARENAKLNGVIDRMLFVQGDLFEPLTTEAKFDLILFNAPYLPVDDVDGCSWLGRAWSGGTAGRQVLDRFICESPRHLGQDGQILLMQSTLSDIDGTVLKLKEHGLKVKIVAECALPFFEAIVLFQAKR